MCEPVGAASPVVAGGTGGGRGIGEGSGMSRGSVTGWAELGASEEIARDPGEYHTRARTTPVFMIENIRTSKYDGWLDMLGPAGGPVHPD